MDRLHKRLRQIAFYEEPIESDATISSQAITSGTQTQTDLGDNLLSQKPFKHYKFKRPAKGRGPPGPLNLEAMILANERDLNKRKESSKGMRKNVTPDEIKALKDLTQNQNIVLKEADKGSSIVIMNRLDYLREGYRQLSDEGSYKELDHDVTDEYRGDIQNEIEDMYQSGEIEQTVRNYLMDAKCRPSRVYFLPKIHKKKGQDDKIPPGRPVVSGNGCPTEKISQFVDHFLTPTTKHIKSYVKDTTDFLGKINKLGKMPPGTIIASLDVVALYPNIPNKEGMEAAKRTFSRTRPGYVQPSNESLLKLLNLVLTKNNFQFNGKNYLQIRGTAIGTKTAVSFANNYMGEFERLFVYLFGKQPLVWYRFIDDVFIVWTHGLEALHEFVEYLNSRVETIKFTMEHSETEVSFLDTKVKITDGKIFTDLYSKPTDSHSYLMYDSAHPQRCKDSIPYGQFLRVRRICSHDTDFDRHIIQLTAHFLSRGYPMKLLEEAAKLTKKIDRNELLRDKDKGDQEKVNDKVFLITTYNPDFQDLRKTVFNNWDMLGKSPTTEYIFEKRLMCGYRRPRNIKDHIVNAAIPFREGDEQARQNGQIVQEAQEGPVGEMATPEIVTEENIKSLRQTSILDFIAPVLRLVPVDPVNRPQAVAKAKTDQKKNLTQSKNRGFNFCNTRGCRYCPRLNKTGNITSTVTGKTFESMKNISCRSSNLIYCITCLRCRKQYVGQTSLRLKGRFVHHFYTVEKPDKTKPVGKHFSRSDHKTIDDMEIHVLEFIKKPPKSEAANIIRDRVEKRWIHLLRTPAPGGLNIED